MHREEKIKKIEEILDDLQEWELQEAHNCYCRKTNRTKDIIHDREELNEVLRGETPLSIAWMIQEDFDITDCYFWFNGNKALKSSSWVTDKVDTEELAKILVDIDFDCGLSKIRVILDEADS